MADRARPCERGGCVMSERSSDRPEYVSESEIEAAAEAFVAAIGWRNAERLRRNLALTVQESDALKALNAALNADFNVVRQEQIRREWEREEVRR